MRRSNSSYPFIALQSVVAKPRFACSGRPVCPPWFENRVSESILDLDQRRVGSAVRQDCIPGPACLSVPNCRPIDLRYPLSFAYRPARKPRCAGQHMARTLAPLVSTNTSCCSVLDSRMTETDDCTTEERGNRDLKTAIFWKNLQCQSGPCSGFVVILDTSGAYPVYAPAIRT